MSSPAWRTLALDRGDHGVRIDRVLLRHLRDERVSRNQIQNWIEAGGVLVNGAPAPRAAWRVQAGDAVAVRFDPRPPKSRPAAESIPLDALYEDADLLAINKPPGLVVHPSYKNAGGTLMNGVLALARDWPAGSKPALLGRLDKHTSGVVLITKSGHVHAALQRAMDARQVDKDYLAVVWGKPSPARGSIDLALDRDPWDRRRITVTDRGGQPSVTRYERIATAMRGTAMRGDKPSGLSFSLVRLRLITGRTHQIRVHLAAKGWPIVGDAVYGRKATRIAASDTAEIARAFSRQALHAWRLAFRHPVSGKELSIVAPLPEDMGELARALGLPVDIIAHPPDKPEGLSPRKTGQ
ncbi:MAG: RluA family pseudouridine synthase [Acidobacteriota bacterium]|nr:RluA family pseudouridine synthase [Acidobacteriota bacterium]